MRVLTLAVWLVARTAAAQQPATVLPDSARGESVPAPPPPSPEQLRYLDGLKTVGRGVAQLKDGVTRVANAGSDTSKLKLAARRLGGLCGAARGFMTSGRTKMQPAAYADSTQIKARKLTVQIDTLVHGAGRCEASAIRQTDSTAAGLLTQLRAYEGALRDFRAAIGLPNRPPAP